MPAIQITLPINLSFVIGSFLMSAITNSEHSIIGWINDALARLTAITAFSASRPATFGIFVNFVLKRFA